MTQFAVILADGRTAQAEADEVRVTDTGALVLSTAGAPLVPVAVFAARQWVSCWPDSAQILWIAEPRPAPPEPPKRTPRAL